MTKFIRSACVAMVLALAGSIAVAAPASAETRECRSNKRSISLPNKPDVDVLVTLCVVRTGGLVQARANLSWQGSLGFIGGTRFNDFVVHVRLERYDVAKKSAAYNQLWGLNNQYSNSRSLGFYMTDRPLGGWSADGYVTVDVNNDGAGDWRWDLHGSPVIR